MTRSWRRGRGRGSVTLVSMAAAIGLVGTLVMPGAATDSSALWSDTSKVTASPVQLGTLPTAPKQASGAGLNCSASNGSNPKTVTYSWARATGTAGIAQVYTAKAYVRTSANGARNELPVTVSTQSGQNNLMVQLSNSSSSGLIGLLTRLLGNLLGSKSYIELEVTASYPNAPQWSRTTVHTTATYQVLLLNLGNSFSCT
ncbi:MAG: hypothetical protein ACTIJ6_10970 [Leucobacter sp.]